MALNQSLLDIYYLRISHSAVKVATFKSAIFFTQNIVLVQFALLVTSSF